MGKLNRPIVPSFPWRLFPPQFLFERLSDRCGRLAAEEARQIKDREPCSKSIVPPKAYASICVVRLMFCGVALILSACATDRAVGRDAFGRKAADNPTMDNNGAPAPLWAGYGYIGRDAEANDQNRIDTYATRFACEAGVESWRSRQVAGTFVWGECLPVDRN
ncbi:MAG: hypothetical protein AAF720_01670 [Pseudomonadota bacterium]